MSEIEDKNVEDFRNFKRKFARVKGIYGIIKYNINDWTNK